jgi:hypothetical protein
MGGEAAALAQLLLPSKADSSMCLSMFNDDTVNKEAAAGYNGIRGCFFIYMKATSH